MMSYKLSHNNFDPTSKPKYERTHERTIERKSENSTPQCTSYVGGIDARPTGDQEVAGSTPAEVTDTWGQ